MQISQMYLINQRFSKIQSTVNLLFCLMDLTTSLLVKVALVYRNPAISVFIVCKPIQHTNTDDRILQIGGDSYSLAVSAGSDGWSWRYTGGNEIYSSVNLSSEYLLTFVRPAGGDFSSASFFIYGIEQTRTNGYNDNRFPSNNESVYTIGSKFGGNDWYYNGTIGEIIVTDSDSNEIRQKTEGYLAQNGDLEQIYLIPILSKMILHYLVWMPTVHSPSTKFLTSKQMIVITPLLFLQQTITTLHSIKTLP